jgi:diguanylate cyclase (GGDEF)-like protein
LGVASGDRILAAFGGLADDLLRKDRGYDRAGRGPADSFIVFLGDTDAENAVSVAERMRQTIAASSFALDTEEVKLTVSMGVACGDEDQPLGQALSRAAQAARCAREQGGNRTCRHADAGPQLETPRPYQVKGRVVKVEPAQVVG